IASIGLVDTNSDPTLLTHPIPGNDDATKSIRIVVDAIVEAIQKGLAQRESRHTARQQPDKTEAAPATAEAGPEAPAAPATDEEVPAGERPAVTPRKRSTRTAGAKKATVSTEDV